MCLSFRTSLRVNLSYEIEFDLQENEPVGRAHLNMNGFARTRFDIKAQGNSIMGYSATGTRKPENPGSGFMYSAQALKFINSF